MFQLFRLIITTLLTYTGWHKYLFLGIPVLKNLPVGKKMYDHPTFLGILFEINQHIVFDYDKVLTNVKELLDFVTLGKGQITSIGNNSIFLFWNCTCSIFNWIFIIWLVLNAQYVKRPLCALNPKIKKFQHVKQKNYCKINHGAVYC